MLSWLQKCARIQFHSLHYSDIAEIYLMWEIKLPNTNHKIVYLLLQYNLSPLGKTADLIFGKKKRQRSSMYRPENIHKTKAVTPPTEQRPNKI